MNRLDFLEARRAGIGSSDVAAVLGLSPWKTALDVYLDKVRPVQPQRLASQLEWGQRLEPAIAGAIKDHYGWELAKPKTIVHRVHQFLIASPDRENDNGELCEIKSASRAEGWGEPETDQTPEHYWIQAQHQLEVVASHRPEVETCWVFVLIGQNDFRRYCVRRDPEFLGTVLGPLREFWDRVESQTPPEPDWDHPNTLEAVQRLFPVRDGVTVELAPEISSWADQYQDLGERIKELTAERDQWKARLIAAIGEAQTGLLSDGRKLSRKQCHRKGYTVEPCDYTTFTIQKAKGA